VLDDVSGVEAVHLEVCGGQLTRMAAVEHLPQTCGWILQVP
jgi:hypothetical protein